MNQQERIDHYLNHRMSSDERSLFEAEIIANPALAEAVAFQQNLSRFFEERAPELEATLANMGEQHFKVEKPKKTMPWSGWFIPLLLAGLGIVIFWWKSNQYSTPSVTIKETILSTENATPNAIDTLKEIPIISPNEVSPNPIPQKPLDTLPNNFPSSSKTPPLIASLNPADFQPNPVLESLMREQVRNSENITTVSIPSLDTVFAFNQPVSFKIAGTSTVVPPYQLAIYTNRVFDFENDYRLLSQSLPGIPQNNAFKFSFNAKIPFSKGLYYIVLLTESEEELLHISRFKIE